MKISINLIWTTVLGIFLLSHSGSLAEEASEPDVSLKVTGEFSFEEDSLSGRIMEGAMVLSGLRSPNTLITVGKPSRSLRAETLEVTFSYDHPPLESGTYRIISLPSYQEEESPEEVIIASVKYQEEDSHPRDSVTYDQAVQGSLTLVREDETLSGVFLLSAEDSDEKEIVVEGEFSRMPVILLD